MADGSNANQQKPSLPEKDKGKAPQNNSSSSAASAIGASASALLATFASPDAISGSLSSATAQKGQSSTSSTSQHRDLERSTYASASASSHGVGGSVSQRAFRTADSAYSNGIQSEYETFTHSQHSIPTQLHSEFAGISSSSNPATFSNYTPAYTENSNDGDAVLAFLASPNTTDEIYSPTPDTSRRPPAPTPSQAGYNQILADATAVQDPVEYLLSSSSYTSDVWGDEWPELQLAKAEMEKGNQAHARARIESILGRIKAKI
ncbi:hypothetical protein BZA70DRAFT_265782 [Myxozyma melibiosi]|uniref:Uncharacterized protein n=1 Tax=Myxozyma melibiosi TaxID=54550 RepID=A0ABR1FFW4_9ASCO